MNHIAIGILALLASCNPAFAQGKKAVVCPPHLSYCYEKPVLREKPVADDIAEIEQRMRILRDLQDRDHYNTIRRIGRL
jgi:hypothetical protein